MDTWQWQSTSAGRHFLNINIDYNLAYTWGGWRMLTLYFKQDWIQNSCALYFFLNCCQTVNNLCCTNRYFQHVVVTLLSHSIQLCLTASCADSPSDMLLMNKIQVWQNQSASGFIQCFIKHKVPGKLHFPNQKGADQKMSRSFRSKVSLWMYLAFTEPSCPVCSEKEIQKWTHFLLIQPCTSFPKANYFWWWKKLHSCKWEIVSDTIILHCNFFRFRQKGGELPWQ
jgi:hypothetical protein